VKTHCRIVIGAGTILAALAIPAAQAQDKPDTKAILKAADDATKAVTAISYEGQWYVDGPAAKQAGKVDGKLLVKRGATDEALMVRIEGTVTPGDGSEPRPILIASNGKEVFRVNYRRKRFETGKAPEALRNLGGAMQIWMREYAHPTPFTDELNGTSTYEGTKKIGDVECDVINVKYSGGQGEGTWYFGKEDHLPRCVERNVREGNKAVQKLTKVNIKPEISDASFTLEAPAGFARTGFTPPPPQRDEPMLQKGADAPAWELFDAGDKKITLDSLKGKAVVLYFWATFSDPGKEGLAVLNEVHKKVEGKPVAIYGISTWERGGDPAKLMTEKGYKFGLLLKGDDMSEEYKVEGVPTIYVIDPAGKIAYGGVGDESAAELEEIIDKALATK